MTIARRAPAGCLAGLLAGALPCEARPLPLTGDFFVNTFTIDDQNHSATAMDADGNFVVAWVSEENSDDNAMSQDGDSAGIFAQRFDDQAQAVGSEFPVNMTTARPQRFPAVALGPGAA